MSIRFSRLKTMILASLCCVTVVAPLLSSNMATADDAPANWSWTDAAPTVYSTTALTDMAPNYCPYSYLTKEVVQELSLQKVCMASNESMEFGVYQSDGYLQAVVGFKYDTKMHKVKYICQHFDNCLFSPGSDTLIVKSPSFNGLYKNLIIYKNLSSRLKPASRSDVYDGFDYTFDASDPEYILKSSTDYYWPIGGVGVSENGDWLAVEFRQRGIGLLNLKTLEMKRISAAAFYYGYGMDAVSELAVSNDGKHVAVAGQNVDLLIFDVNNDCGEVADDNAMESIGYSKKPCPNASVNTDSFIYRFRYATKPRFNIDGGELGFFAISYDAEPRQVYLRVAGYGGQRLDYLALGDSFTSGEGETEDIYYMAGTNDEYEKCHVSTRSYPFVVAQWSHIDPVYMKSVACSGATTVDIVGNDPEYSGQNHRLDKSGLDYVSMTLARYNAINSFVQGRIYQADFVKKYQPEVVTIGIGGNDAGFMQKLKSCIGLGTCDFASTSKGRIQTANEIRGLFNILLNTYQQIHSSSPSTKIYAVGYPRIINPDGQCGFVFNRLLNDTEKKFIDEGIIYLNSVVSAAARAAGIGYIDVQDSYGEFALCGSNRPGVMEAMNAIAYGDDNNMINNSRWLRFIGNESFHPNSLGHSLVANSIMSSVGNIMDYDYCANGLAICPDLTVVAPEPSAYWKTEDNVKYPLQLVSEFVFNNSDLSKSIILNSQSLSPNSSVSIELHSDVVALGDFVAENDGSLNVRLELPSDIEDGYHTVHLYGTSYSGESVDLYQIIKCTKPTTSYAINSDTLTTELVSNKTKNVEVNEVLGKLLDARLDDKAIENNSDNHIVRSLEVESASNETLSLTDSIMGASVKGISTTPDVSKSSLLNNRDYISSDATLAVFVVLITLIGIIKLHLYRDNA